MNKTSKGMLAVGAAGMLLLGGAGSLAYWSDSDSVPGSAFSSGSLHLTAINSCDVWNLETGEPGGQPFDPTTGFIVPGDVITKVCTFDVDAVGEHLRATVAAVPGSNSGALLSSLTVAATNLEIDAATISSITDGNDGDVLSVTVAVTFNTASNNTTQSLAATLASINIVTQQVHS